MFTLARILDRYEYQEFIIESLHPDNVSISDHLFSYYQLQKSINHKFCEIIHEEIQGIISAAISEFKMKKKDTQSAQNYKTKKFAVLDKRKVLTEIPKDNLGSYLQRMTSINQLNKEYSKFIHLVETSENSGKSSIKIDWDSDSKNHLYFILKELKNAGLIKNSLPDLAIFVKENIPLFSNKSLTSIRDAIQKGLEPKRGSIETVKIIKKIKG
jgi:hypothetical protein